MNSAVSAFKHLFALLLTVALPVQLLADVTLVAHLDRRHGGPGPNFGFYYASCWGYVAPDGHEYALIACYSGTSIIDLDANPIAEVAYVPGSNSEWHELKTWGHYAYCVSENPAQGLQIIDLSQLPNSATVENTLFNVGGHNIANTHTITVADGFLYLNGGSSNGTVILDLADPENPAYVGQFQPSYLHDTYVKRDTLYGAAIYGEGVFIADVSNKAAPQQIGRITYSGSGTHNTWRSDFGNYLFTTDEIGTTQKNMKVFDISNLPSFTQENPFTANPSSIIHNVHGRGNYVYIAHYNAGVYVADVHDPLNITNAGGYDTYTGGGSGYIGCWGVYPYFPSGRWIASDTQTGLYVFSFDGLAARIRSPLLAPADGSLFPEGSTATFVWRSAALQSEDPHRYELHISGGSLDTLIETQDTTVSVDLVTPFVSGVTYSWHVLIRDEFTTVSSQDTFQFSVGASGIPCEEITQFRTRCRTGGTIQARIITSTSYAGEPIGFAIDGDLYETTVGPNGRALLSVSGFGIGSHEVELTEPSGCYDPVTVNCAAGVGKGTDELWDDDEVSTATVLLGNHPNPFNPSTTIRYVLSKETHVSLSIYDMLGRLVRTIVNRVQSEGFHEAVWDGRNASGAPVGSGIYLYKLEAGGFSQVHRMILMR
jgi:choice-of-anchor B domain-containing protein